MSDNVTLREAEAGTDRSHRLPAAPEDDAAEVRPTTAEPLTTGDVAVAGGEAPDREVTGGRADDRAAMPAGGPGEPVVATSAADRGTPTAAAPRTDGDGASTPLFGADQASTYRSRWQEIQIGFVDEPRAAVEEADALVAELMRQLARTFADERRDLEGQWAKGAEISTEDLRIALRRYRSFFDRLLSV